MTESDLHKALAGLVRKLWPDATPMLHRVENTAAIGTFDTFMGSDMGCGWIELKICGPNAKPDMRPGQPGFGYRCLSAGVPAHVLCCSDSGDVKLILGNTVGYDWRSLLVMRSSLSEPEAMRDVLLACIEPVSTDVKRAVRMVW